MQRKTEICFAISTPLNQPTGDESGDTTPVTDPAKPAEDEANQL